MRGAALSDLHLGFRSYNDTTDGRNTREVDVERAWHEAIEGILAENRYDSIGVVTIAGDVFHHPRVSDYAKKAFIDGIQKLLNASMAVIVLQGNHDAGRTAEVLTPIMLVDGLRGPGELYVVTRPERIQFQTLGESVSVACFPFVARGDDASYRLDPDPTADVNLLVMHAAVKGDVGGDALPYFYGGHGALDVGKESERWDVIHCGDYHEFRRLHPTRLAFYPGSLERTSSNIWQETAPKGWVLWDTSDQSMELMEVSNRRMVDLGEGEPSADGVNRLLAGIVDMDPLAGSIVRLKVDDFPREEREHVDWATVRAIKAKACHFNLDLRYASPELVEIGDRRERQGRSLADEAAAFFAEDSEGVRLLAIHYLDVEAEVEDEEVAHA